MRIKNKILEWLYPVLIFFNKISRRGRLSLTGNIQAPSVFFDLSMPTGEGTNFNFQQLREKKTLIVNTASSCGYTPQYKAFESIYRQFGHKLNILAFPTSDFGNQELSTDEEIAAFCSRYSVTFPVMQKSKVGKGVGQNEVFQWLTQSSKNGWNELAPQWNFFKYLIDENGNLTHVWGSGIEPAEIANELEKL